MKAESECVLKTIMNVYVKNMDKINVKKNIMNVYVKCGAIINKKMN